MYKLLIVDDNTTQIQSVIHFIDWKSLLVTEIKTATNGRDGVSVAQEFRPDIIITDVAMPLMNGIEMTATIKNLGLKSRFIYMSCYEDFDYVKQAIDHEVTGYILKPIDPTELLQAVRKVIEEINQNQKHENMDKLLQESLPIFRENFLYRLLYSRNFNLEEIRQNSQNLGYEAYRSFLVGKLQLSPQGLVPSELIDTYQILNVIKERMLKAPGIDCDVIIESRNNLILYLMGNQEDTELFLTAALAELKALSLYIQETFHTTVCIGLSNVHQLLIETPSMLMQASLA
ncbi:MAG: response regulator, partial [Evtepia sp.]